MAKPKLKSLKSLDQLKAGLPPATAKRAVSRGEGKQVMLVAPLETHAALRAKAAQRDTTVRMLILEALQKAGYPVPAEELSDRRSTRD